MIDDIRDAITKGDFCVSRSLVVDRELSLPLQKYLPNTIVGPTGTREELANVRNSGYAITKSEFDFGVTALGVPIEIPNAGVVFSKSEMFSTPPLSNMFAHF